MEWTRSDLDDVLAQLRDRRGDSALIEVKRATGGVPKMPETLCAFANMPTGGTIILGVDEGNGDFEVLGVANVAQLEAGLASMARNSVEPCPHLEFQTLHVGTKAVVIVHVSPLPLMERPARVGKQAYLRQADGDYPMEDYEERMIGVAQLHAEEQVTYDLSPVIGGAPDDLDPNLTREYINAVRAHDRRLRDYDDQQILRMTSVLNASGEPTLAGLYALGRYPQGKYPALTVTAAVQLPGGEGQARNRNLQDFTGPLPLLLAELLDWVAANLSTIRRYRPDGHMAEDPELPLNAIRELLANALVHRDLGPNTLGYGKQIQVRLTPRNLFIQSPGGLRGVSLKQLESVEHAQAAVNQRLYQMAKRLTTADGASIIEGEGGGIREVFRAVEARGLPRPQLRDTGVQFTAFLWRPHGDTVDAAAVDTPVVAPSESAHPVSSELPHSSAPTRNEATVVTVLSLKARPLTIHELSDAAELSIGQVRYALKKLIEERIVTMEGKQGQRSTRYRLQ
ncbi:putative DNA binding domain-containing protein [Corynebacterium uropygiale]|uniref:DNA binding domain-containing protein n=1 Tax=Corynebacterium uropygiale TaxID=1775911 RepID=A0A9X1TZG3_9CORY|nr:ATP-binding protein [Corynebacterium uropygiale]MCF4006861.1 putative DNA binding domain-containing protein [Corynebacterium uropygiale]